jgi:hypothetical protein
MNWMLDIIISHRRMRGLSEAQLLELIEKCDDIEGLRTIKDHLEQNDFRYPHLESKAPELIQRCITRGKLLMWKKEEEKLKLAFMKDVNPFN